MILGLRKKLTLLIVAQSIILTATILAFQYTSLGAFADRVAGKAFALKLVADSRSVSQYIKTYYGKDFTVDANDCMEWAYIPHFYRGFYVFQYATSMAAANLLGSNLFNVAILAVDDAVYTPGPLLAAVSPGHAVTALGAVAMSVIVIAGLVVHPKPLLGRLTLPLSALMLTYIVITWLAF